MRHPRAQDAIDGQRGLVKAPTGRGGSNDDGQHNQDEHANGAGYAGQPVTAVLGAQGQECSRHPARPEEETNPKQHPAS